ncbi:hypothetical protein D3C77_767170 [compost metagenome]
MMGAGPFSFASARDSCQPVIASSWETCSVKATEAAEPYFICSMVRVDPRPRKPMPWRRLAVISSRCLGSGN